MTELGEFLRLAATKQARGNCSTLPADWCVALGLPDFAGKWREVTGLAADSVLVGELLAHWDEAIGDAIPVASAPFLAGDIAIIRRCIWEAGAIFTGERWAFRRPRGLSFAPVANGAIVKAWRPCPKS